MNPTEIPVDRVAACKVGLVADTHSAQSDGSDLPDAVLAALRGVDLIVHLGDMGAVGVLDRFARVAPVLATRGHHAVGDDPRIASHARVVEACGYSVGALFDLARAHESIRVLDTIELPPGPLDPLLEALFGRRVDVVAFAATHRPLLLRKDGVLFVNPGSPNLPAAGPGTVAIIELGHPEPRAEIRQIEANHPPAAILDSRFDDARA
ncbi:MAG TPA: metallophosphoesterase family protein [Myxococcota bacterium]|nr:metallophosphoesterase family protein [Myxococcota bacterium]